MLMGKNYILPVTGMADREILIFMFRKKMQSGDWGPAVNLGAAINTPYNEDTPFITQNDSVLYFSFRRT